MLDEIKSDFVEIKESYKKNGDVVDSSDDEGLKAPNTGIIKAAEGENWTCYICITDNTKENATCRVCVAPKVIDLDWLVKETAKNSKKKK